MSRNGQPEQVQFDGVHHAADSPWQTLAAGLTAFEPGFVLAREQPPHQPRAAIDAAVAAPAASAPTRR